jgi:4-diphosphocytidyl-2-C-methyl-D-erythritol kinase
MRVDKSFGRVSPSRTVTIFSPAKINLFLAVTGRRSDGYHDLVSVVAPLDFGDVLAAEIRGGGLETRERKEETGEPTPEDGAHFSLVCDNPEVPVDGSNLVLKAAEAFAGATGWKEPVLFRLTKRIPVGSGMGGGSSNATAALLMLNELSGANLGWRQALGRTVRCFWRAGRSSCVVGASGLKPCPRRRLVGCADGRCLYSSPALE